MVVRLSFCIGVFFLPRAQTHNTTHNTQHNAHPTNPPPKPPKRTAAPPRRPTGSARRPCRPRRPRARWPPGWSCRGPSSITWGCRRRGTCCVWEGGCGVCVGGGGKKSGGAVVVCIQKQRVFETWRRKRGGPCRPSKDQRRNPHTPHTSPPPSPPPPTTHTSAPRELAAQRRVVERHRQPRHLCEIPLKLRRVGVVRHKHDLPLVRAVFLHARVDVGQPRREALARRAPFFLTRRLLFFLQVCVEKRMCVHFVLDPSMWRGTTLSPPLLLHTTAQTATPHHQPHTTQHNATHQCAEK